MNSYYSTLLEKRYPTKQSIVTEIINLEAILNLPKGTEHFVSDVHGEYNAFQHVLRNGSGNVKQKIQETFNGRLTEANIQDFAILIYYPEEKLVAKKQQMTSKSELEQWYLDTIGRMLELLQKTATKYSRSKVRKAISPDFLYITEELLYSNSNELDQRDYYNRIIENLIDLNQAEAFLTVTAYTIQRLVVDHLHVIGDIFDRGPNPDKIMKTLMDYHSVDIQWGNHDILWLGGVAGSPLCIANLLRICARYNNLAIVEDAYGINLRHLASFADKMYQDNPAFSPKVNSAQEEITEDERLLMTKMHQAMAIIQFKLEGQIIQRRPDFDMDNRAILDKIINNGTEIDIDGTRYSLQDTCFQTIDWTNPYELTVDEAEIMDKLVQSFIHATKLREHLDFMMKRGSMFKRYNGNLLVHGCIPVMPNGDLENFDLKGKSYAGPELLLFFEDNLRKSYAEPKQSTDLETDLLWYLWQGPKSPLFGKHAMKTFERYFIDNKEVQVEIPNAYYELRHNEDFCRHLLEEFELNPDNGKIINGHTPVKRGHEPVMANKKMIVIDGGFSKAYQATTGIGGYTLLSNSYGLQLVAHQPFTSMWDSIENGTDIISVKRIIDSEVSRQTIAETDTGKELASRVVELKKYLQSK